MQDRKIRRLCDGLNSSLRDYRRNGNEGKYI